MMAHGGKFPFHESVKYGCRIIAIPYKKNLTTMYVIQPNDSSRTRLRDFQATLTADIIEEMISQMDWKTSIVLFPKMHISNQMNLKKVFRDMGFSSLFNGRESDLSLISNGEEVFQSAPALAPNAGAALSAFAPDFNSLPSEQFLAQPVMKFPGHYDDSNDDQFLFSRIGEEEKGQHNATEDTASNKKNATTAVEKSSEAQESGKRTKRYAISYKAASVFRQDDDPPRLKDYILKKRASKPHPYKKLRSRSRRQIPSHIEIDPSASLKSLDRLRTSASANGLTNPGLLVEEIVHKIDLVINEKGTEGGAATVTHLLRSGTDVVFRAETPFLFLIRHEDTKLPLFYGAVNEPTNF